MARVFVSGAEGGINEAGAPFVLGNGVVDVFDTVDARTGDRVWRFRQTAGEGSLAQVTLDPPATLTPTMFVGHRLRSATATQTSFVTMIFGANETVDVLSYVVAGTVRFDFSISNLLGGATATYDTGKPVDHGWFSVLVQVNVATSGTDYATLCIDGIKVAALADDRLSAALDAISIGISASHDQTREVWLDDIIIDTSLADIAAETYLYRLQPTAEATPNEWEQVGGTTKVGNLSDRDDTTRLRATGGTVKTERYVAADLGDVANLTSAVLYVCTRDGPHGSATATAGTYQVRITEGGQTATSSSITVNPDPTSRTPAWVSGQRPGGGSWTLTSVNDLQLDLHYPSQVATNGVAVLELWIYAEAVPGLAFTDTRTHLLLPAPLYTTVIPPDRPDAPAVTVGEATESERLVVLEDTATVGVADQSASFLTVTPTDILAVAATDAPDPVAAVVESGDAAAVAATDTTLIVGFVRAGDSTSAALADTASPLLLVQREDAVTVTVADAAAILLHSAATDAAVVAANEASVMTWGMAAGDAAGLTVADDATSPLVLVARPDPLTVTLVEITAAALTVARPDALGVRASESQLSKLLAAATDLLAAGATGTSATQAGWFAADATALSVTDVAVDRLVAAAVADALGVALADTPAVTAARIRPDTLAVALADTPTVNVATTAADRLDVASLDVPLLTLAFTGGDTATVTLVESGATEPFVIIRLVLQLGTLATSWRAGTTLVSSLLGHLGTAVASALVAPRDAGPVVATTRAHADPDAATGAVSASTVAADMATGTEPSEPEVAVAAAATRAPVDADLGDTAQADLEATGS